MNFVFGKHFHVLAFDLSISLMILSFLSLEHFLMVFKSSFMPIFFNFILPWPENLKCFFLKCKFFVTFESSCED
jgi:hypothetical protein